MQSTDITSLLEFYRLAALTLDTQFTLKESAFRCNKALQKSKVERPWQNEIKVEILKLIIMLCNSHPLKELRFLKVHTTNHNQIAVLSHSWKNFIHIKSYTKWKAV